MFIDILNISRFLQLFFKIYMGYNKDEIKV